MGGIFEVAAVVEIAADAEIGLDVVAAAEVGIDAAAIGETVAEAATVVGESFGIGGATGDLAADAALTDVAGADTIAGADLAPVADQTGTVAASNTADAIGAGPGITQDLALSPGTSLNEAGQVVDTATGAPVSGSAAPGSNLAQASGVPASETPVAPVNPNAGTIIDANAPVNPEATGTFTGQPGASQTVANPEAIGSTTGSAGNPEAITSTTTGSTTTPKSDPGFFEKGGFADRNSGAMTLGGGLINGVGSGVSGMAQASSRTASEKIAAANSQALQANQQGFVSGNYSTTGGLLNAQDPTVAGNPTPTQRFDPRSYGGQYTFDQASGRIKFVPNSGAQAIGAPTTAPGAGAGA